MREGARGVERLLWAIYRNADDRTIKALAHYLNYVERQLKEDIAEIPNVNVTEKGTEIIPNSNNIE